MFDISDHLSESEKSQLLNFLYLQKDIFVTPENPSLGYTEVVKHKIILKPDAKSKHHKSYRLSTDKREVLRHQLDELLSQGIIAPVSETEDLFITSPVVLVSKTCRDTSKASSAKDASLQKLRFCCDFRYSQTREFRYPIPNLDELIESFSENVPNYITSIDMCSGFFQMGLDASSSKYTAFNTCFGTDRFLCLPRGLSSSPNTFQLLMDKVLHELKFRSPAYAT